MVLVGRCRSLLAQSSECGHAIICSIIYTRFFTFCLLGVITIFSPTYRIPPRGMCGLAPNILHRTKVKSPYVAKNKWSRIMISYNGDANHCDVSLEWSCQLRMKQTSSHVVL